MGVPKDQATRNRQAIIDTASRVFRERGVDGVGVAELMKQAGFTHGGFYNHFESKDALAAEACAAAFACGAETLKKAIEADPDGHEGAFHAFMEGYLAPQRCDSLGECCPTAALATDAARQGKAMQAAYAQGVEAFIAAMTPYFAAHADEPEARDNAMAMLAGLVGTVVLARGVGAANRVLSEEILDMGRRNLGKGK